MGRPPKKVSTSETGSKPKASNNTRMVGFRMDPALRDFIEREAEKENRTFSNYILTVVLEHAKKKGFKA